MANFKNSIQPTATYFCRAKNAFLVYIQRAIEWNWYKKYCCNCISSFM